MPPPDAISKIQKIEEVVGKLKKEILTCEKLWGYKLLYPYG